MSERVLPRIPVQRPPTMEDVAAVAGVSRGTVSRVLNGGQRVSGPALEAVRRAIRQTGYVVNQHARSLVTHRSDSVAFILAEPHDRIFDDPNFSILLRGCTQALAAEGIMVLLSIASTDEERRRVSRYVNGGHFDGALLVSTQAGNPLLDDFVASGLPVVTCGRPLGHERQIAYASADDREGARQIVSHLVATGRRRIATITGPAALSCGNDRLAGYHDVLGPVDPRMVVPAQFTRASGRAAMQRLLRQVPDLDAVFAAADLVAAGALDALRTAGRKVPDDVAVAGFDDSRVALTTRPTLTTMRQPFARISAEMVRLLLARMAGEPPAAAILPTELVVRDST